MLHRRGWSLRNVQAEPVPGEYSIKNGWVSLLGTGGDLRFLVLLSVFLGLGRSENRQAKEKSMVAGNFSRRSWVEPKRGEKKKTPTKKIGGGFFPSC